MRAHLNHCPADHVLGPAGAVVDATKITDGLARSR